MSITIQSAYSGVFSNKMEMKFGFSLTRSVSQAEAAMIAIIAAEILK